MISPKASWRKPWILPIETQSNLRTLISCRLGTSAENFLEIRQDGVGEHVERIAPRVGALLQVPESAMAP